MTAQAVIAQAHQLGVTLTATERGTVRLVAQSGKVPAPLIEAVREHKREIIDLLNSPPPPSTAFLVVRPDGLSAWLCTDERAVAWAEAQQDGVPVLTVAEVLRIGGPADVPLVLMAKKVFGSGSRVVTETERSRAFRAEKA